MCGWREDIEHAGLGIGSREANDATVIDAIGLTYAGHSSPSHFSSAT